MARYLLRDQLGDCTNGAALAQWESTTGGAVKARGHHGGCDHVLIERHHPCLLKGSADVVCCQGFLMSSHVNHEEVALQTLTHFWVSKLSRALIHVLLSTENITTLNLWKACVECKGQQNMCMLLLCA